MSQYSDMIDVNLPEPEMYIEVTLPGKIIDSNGEVDGSTVRWDLMDKNLDQNLKAVSDEEASGGFPTFLLLLGGMVLVVAVASFVVISQKKKSNGGQNGSYNPYDQGISKTPDMPPGWYPDPNTPGQQRWWDGQAWSDHTG